MAVELITILFACADCGQYDTKNLKPNRECDSYTIQATGHICFRCTQRAHEISERRRSIFLASRQTGR